jgi:hypothetical protein
MALAQMEEIARLNLCRRSAELGEFLLGELSEVKTPKLKIEARGLGLMAGLELRLPDDKPAGAAAMQAVKTMLRGGFILLPEGEHANVIGFTPPLTITKGQLAKAVAALAGVLSTDREKCICGCFLNETFGDAGIAGGTRDSTDQIPRPEFSPRRQSIATHCCRRGIDRGRSGPRNWARPGTADGIAAGKRRRGSRH